MKEIENIRILVIVGIIAVFSWLHWWVLPTLGMFRVLPKDPTVPYTGASLVFFIDGKTAGVYALGGLTLGWSTVWSAWPVIIIGISAGFGLGYLVGEFSRRKFVIELLPKKISQEYYTVSSAAFTTKYSADCILRRAKALYTDADRIKEEVLRERKKLRVMNQSVEEQMRDGEVLRHKAESLEKELIKAKAKIRRLQEKVGQQSGKFD